MTAQAFSSSPILSGLVLSGGFGVASHALRLLEGLDVNIPVTTSPLDTFTAASATDFLQGLPIHDPECKIDVAVITLEQEVGIEIFLSALEVEPSGVVTPIMFQAELVERSRASHKAIVLPEPDNDQVLCAADAILYCGIADLMLLGDEITVWVRITELDLDIAATRVVATDDPRPLEKCAEEFAHLRAKKGVILEQAHEKVQDASHFGTMMVHMGDADGMVSGAVHTAVHTVVPSFQIIKVKPGASIASSVFLILLQDRVLIYGDRTVNPESNVVGPASIAISSTTAARQSGVRPRVAMLSFPIGASGKGTDVDEVRGATELVRAKEPDLVVEDSIQYDVAINPIVAIKKAPDSLATGRANVLIFPDLSSGSIGYKTVRRSSGATVIGPILQGPNKPANNLSRSALVEDIIDAVAITVAQAQD